MFKSSGRRLSKLPSCIVCTCTCEWVFVLLRVFCVFSCTWYFVVAIAASFNLALVLSLAAFILSCHGYHWLSRLIETKANPRKTGIMRIDVIR